MTTRQVVKGVDKASPIGPHSHAQKAAAISKATGVMPVLWPNNSGSTN